MLPTSASKPFSDSRWIIEPKYDGYRSTSGESGCSCGFRIRSPAALQSLLEDCHHVRYLQHVQEHGEAFYRHFEQLGLEGIVTKRADAPYKVGRTRVWKKVKTPAFREIEMCGLKHLHEGRRCHRCRR